MKKETYYVVNPQGEYATDLEFNGCVILLNFTSNKQNAQRYNKNTADQITNRYRSLTKILATTK